MVGLQHPGETFEVDAFFLSSSTLLNLVSTSSSPGLPGAKQAADQRYGGNWKMVSSKHLFFFLLFFFLILGQRRIFHCFSFSLL